MNFNTILNDFNEFINKEVWNNYYLFRDEPDCQLNNYKRRFQICKGYIAIASFMERNKFISKEEHTYFTLKLEQFLFYK